MYAKIFTGLVFSSLATLSLAANPWDATDKALGHEGRGRRTTNQYSYNQYRYQPNAQYSYQPNAAQVVRVVPQRIVPTAPPQIAQTPNAMGRRSFSVEPSAPVQVAPQMTTPSAVPTRSFYPVPHSNRGGARPSWESADTKIRGLEGSVNHN